MRRVGYFSFQALLPSSTTERDGTNHQKSIMQYCFIIGNLHLFRRSINKKKQKLFKYSIEINQINFMLISNSKLFKRNLNFEPKIEKENRIGLALLIINK